MLRDGSIGLRMLSACIFAAPLLGVFLLAGNARAQSASPGSQHANDPETIKKLRAFLAIAGKQGVKDETVLKSLDELKLAVKDDKLATVERFAVSEEGKIVAWPLARFLLEKRQTDAATNILVTRLADQKENRAYAMWKWWEANFAERKDYQALCTQITESLLRQFEKGGKERKQVVAELFGKGEAESQLSTEQFRLLIKMSK
jgi:hypothetical protein